MIIRELISKLGKSGFERRLTELYGAEALEYQTKRYIRLLENYAERFGADGEAGVFSAPGRAEIGGNHTDHQRGRVMAAAVDADCIAAASAADETEIWSEGYGDVSCAPLTRGVADYFNREGYKTGGIKAVMASDVESGSGLSSSAAFEVAAGCCLNHIHNSGDVPALVLAMAGRHAENAFLGKPSGLMDQAASAAGGFVYIDFGIEIDGGGPYVENIPIGLEDSGYVMCAVHTGGGHEDLTKEYAAIPGDMRAVAAELGGTVLGHCDSERFYGRIAEIRASLGDRAALRAAHFFGENQRVLRQAGFLKNGRIQEFLSSVNESGRSSQTCLQNIFAAGNTREQPLSLALALAEKALDGGGAFRVHGGGFAGTILAFVPLERYSAFAETQDAVFGSGSCRRLRVRQAGAVKVL